MSNIQKLEVKAVATPLAKKFVTALKGDLKSGAKLQTVLTELYSIETVTEMETELTQFVIALKIANDLSGTRKYKDTLSFLNTGLKSVAKFHALVTEKEFQEASEIKQKRSGSKALKSGAMAEDVANEFNALIAPKENVEKSTPESVKAMTQTELDKAYSEAIAKLAKMTPDEGMLKKLQAIIKG